ncbi:MAG: 2-oxo acid dehydrogenase subunit E2 [Deltaproteobacteria bacterium]|nr:MAG: 2-oxo acid dehydrogenase subunit E2 [Deltaproteobacteria bacterium]
MRVDVVMPQLGESVVEGVVVKWLVKVGDTVGRDQPLLEISTDKVDAEIPSPEAGRIVEILAKEGDTVPIQEILCRIETEKEAAAPPPPPEKWDEEEEGFPGAMARKTAPPIPAAPREEPPKEAPKPAPAPPEREGPRVRISPVVAKMAAEYDLAISQIPGTGIDGRVTKKDVEEYLARGGREAVPAPPPKRKPAPAPPAPGEKPPPAPGEKVTPEGDRVIPFTPIRKMIAEHMVMSKRTSPHVHTFAEVDMHRVVAFRAAKKKEGVSLTYLPFVIWAAIEAIREFPVLNAQVVGESTVLKKAIHIGVAVDTERGLIVPVIRNADEKSLLGLAKAVEDLAARAEAKKILPDELAGGTFTVSNPGLKGNLFGTPIINQPQVGILRMGQIVKRPVVVEARGEDAIVIRPMMYLCLGYDHRVVDGVAGNSFLFRVREILEAGEFRL